MSPGSRVTLLPAFPENFSSGFWGFVAVYSGGSAPDLVTGLPYSPYQGHLKLNILSSLGYHSQYKLSIVVSVNQILPRT